MHRETIEERPNKSQRLQERVFDSLDSSCDIPYWDEKALYSFSMKEADEIEAAAEELHKMCIQAAGYVIENNLMGEFGIPEHSHEYIRDTFEREDPILYGRFDFSFDGVNPPKMLEYNADTPTCLYESAVLQWDWLEDRREQDPVRFANVDQYNSLHEALVEQWQKVSSREGFPETVHFMAMLENLEDNLTTAYIEETARQAGITTHLFDIAHMGRTMTDFVDDRNQIIKGAFKLYPWEFLLSDEEDYSQFYRQDRTGFIEPAWKAILSNKNILPVLWEMSPGHPNLLPAFKSASAFGDQPYVKKAVLGREGASVTIFKETGEVIASPGPYDDSGFVYQAHHPLPDFEGNFPVVGAWIVGDECRGMNIREDDGPITQNSSRFIPHIVRMPS